MLYPPHHVIRPASLSSPPLWPEVEVASTRLTRCFAVECRTSRAPLGLLVGPASSHRSIPLLNLSSSPSVHVNVRPVNLIPHLKTRSQSDYLHHFNSSLRPRLFTLHHGFKRFQAGPSQAPRVSDTGHDSCTSCGMGEQDPTTKCHEITADSPKHPRSHRVLRRGPLRQCHARHVPRLPGVRTRLW